MCQLVCATPRSDGAWGAARRTAGGTSAGPTTRPLHCNITITLYSLQLPTQQNEYTIYTVPNEDMRIKKPRNDSDRFLTAAEEFTSIVFVNLQYSSSGISVKLFL